MTYRLSDFPSAGEMDPISLDEMKSVSLMNRTDTKYVTDTEHLKAVIDDALAAGYRICEISGQRMLDYSSVYYDTADLKMFTMHRNGKKIRQKVRVRTYLIDNVTFIEVKTKDNHGRTKKKRTRIQAETDADPILSQAAAGFLSEKSWWKASELLP
ncbi:MAG: VTC domain-containing protein, partial [Bacteroidales bacterium]|nr:VTC domain-containing protein [Bacteroidales bacterium]